MHDQSRNPIAATQSLLDELIATVESGSIAQRLRILHRIADLFMAGSRGYSGEQIAVFDDVLQQLCADLECGVRASLARRLADVENAPSGLIRRFAFDDAIEVAAPVLVCSPQLSDNDLVANARSMSQAHLLAIAQRLKLSEAVTDVLVERGDRRVVQQAARNRGARFSLAGYDKMIVRADSDRKLTLALAKRGDLPRQCFLKLLESASASVRLRLEASHPQYAAEIRDSVDQLAARLQDEARALSGRHGTAERKVAKRFRSDAIGDEHLHAAAHAQDFERAAIVLARRCKFPLDLVERALLDGGIDMLLIVARAAGCSWVTAREMLQMHVAGRMLGPDDLRACAERYRRLKPATAENILRFRERRLKLRDDDPTHAGPSASPVIDLELARCAASA